jgi:hypothetical protein
MRWLCGQAEAVGARVALGYIGWVLTGIGGVQAGLARRQSGGGWKPGDAMAAFLDKIAPAIAITKACSTHCRARTAQPHARQSRAKRLVERSVRSASVCLLKSIRRRMMAIP